MLTNELRSKFCDLAGELSPENLSCDGELSRWQVTVKERRIRKEWASLEKQAGRKVTEDEVWGWIIPR